MINKIRTGKILVDFSITPKIRIEKGSAKAVLSQERTKPYYGSDMTFSRDYDIAYQERIDL